MGRMRARFDRWLKLHPKAKRSDAWETGWKTGQAEAYVAVGQELRRLSTRRTDTAGIFIGDEAIDRFEAWAKEQTAS